MILTDDEIYTMYSEPCSDAEMIEFARAIEAAILEKLEGKLKDAARYNYLRTRDPRKDCCDQCGYDGLHLRAGYLLDLHIDDMMRYEQKNPEYAQLSGNTEQLIKVLDDVRQTLRYIPEDRVADACEINAAIVKINEVLK